MKLRFICSFLILAAHFSALSASGGAVPFRLAVFDNYESMEEYDSEASDVYGVRLGIFGSCNKRMYGVSISSFADGASTTPSGVLICADDDWAGLKIGGLNCGSCGSGIGVQVGGIAWTDGLMAGIQIGGTISECGTLNGLQVGVLGAYAELGMGGIQIGGLNVTVGEEDREATGGNSFGIQMAALRCRVWHGAFTGLQVGGSTFADDLSGVQIGVFNRADSLHGLQIGIVNRVQDLHGVQIGIVNVSGNEDSGEFRVLPILNARF